MLGQKRVAFCRTNCYMQM